MCYIADSTYKIATFLQPIKDRAASLTSCSEEQYFLLDSHLEYLVRKENFPRRLKERNLGHRAGQNPFIEHTRVADLKDVGKIEISIILTCQVSLPRCGALRFVIM